LISIEEPSRATRIHKKILGEYKSNSSRIRTHSSL
jgi:hypothetical protein